MTHRTDTHKYSKTQLLPPRFAKSHEIPRKFKLISVQSHPRWLSFVSIESA